MKTFTRFLFVFLFGTGMAILALFGASRQAANASPASPQFAIRYVATTGSDTTACTESANPCATIQYAVDQAASGDEVRVATGEYTDVHARVEHDPFPSDETLTQMVFITQPLTLRGGYTTTDWTIAFPELYPTALNPQGQGRGIVVMTTEGVTVEGFQVFGGDATVDGYLFARGGGIGVFYSSAAINDCYVEANVGSGGIGVDSSAVSLQGNEVVWHQQSGVVGYYSTLTITQNIISGNEGDFGGGLRLEHSIITLWENEISGNIGQMAGGGVWSVYSPNMTVMSNTITGNISGDNGGGLLIALSTGSDVIVGNTVQGNVSLSGFGGGVFAAGPAVTFRQNVVTDNQAGYLGGGLYATGTLFVSENIFMQNTAEYDGGRIYIGDGSQATLQHNLIQQNQGVDGGGLNVDYSTVTLTANTILSNTATGWGGGGLYLLETDATLDSNRFAFNSAEMTIIGGGGIYVDVGSQLVSTNDLLVKNSASTHGGGLVVNSTLPVQLAHSTFAENLGGDGSAIFNIGGNLWMTNTILVSHTIGVLTNFGATSHFEATLWHNDVNFSGAGTINIGSHNRYGEPAFVDPVHDDYHLTANSLAVDAGINAGVTTDADGDSRPAGASFDLGIDELANIFSPIGLVQLQGRSDHSGVVVTAWSGGMIVATATTGISGTYALIIPDGVYKITIERPLYLDAVKNNVYIANASAFSLAPVMLPVGDANDSDKINIYDLTIIGAHYTMTCADPNWDPRADLNNDCLVDLLDLTLAAGNFGQTSPVPWE